jgi:hypothetical protein
MRPVWAEMCMLLLRSYIGSCSEEEDTIPFSTAKATSFMLQLLNMYFFSQPWVSQS